MTINIFVFFRSWVITIGIETVLLFLLVRFWYKIGARELTTGRLLFSGIFCSGCTLPYVWFVAASLLKSAGFSYFQYWLLTEGLVWLVEGIFYIFVLNLGVRRSMIISLLCNAASAGAGLLMDLPDILPWLQSLFHLAK